MLVLKCLKHGVSEITSAHDSMLMQKFQNKARCDHTVIYTDIPPSDSPYYRKKVSKCMVTLLEDGMFRFDLQDP